MHKSFSSLPSWGLNPKSQGYIDYINPKQPTPKPIVSGESQKSTTCLPYGLGRSYGDSCLNNNNTLCPTNFLDMLLEFDQEKGTLKAQAGASLKDILNIIVPKGWFVPVSPGTKYITLGGAIANDIHGKNHHRCGCFGNHVQDLKVLRTNGDKIHSTPSKNQDFFAATIGGLGLTGLITEATISLKPIKSAQIVATHTPFESLEEFFSINSQKEPTNEYTVAWIDTLSPKGKGIYIAGNHSDWDNKHQYQSQSPSQLSCQSYHSKNKPSINIPTFAPNFLLNPLSIKAFNHAYYLLQKNKTNEFTTGINSFFYPLDGLGNWNKLYGKRGFFQYQCVIPDIHENSKLACLELLQCIARSKQGSFLAVLKTFGDIKPLGLLSFPTKGITIALDFPNNGEKTLQLFKNLDAIIRQVGGRLYPAKDANMTSQDFQNFYPNLEEFKKFKDPNISSSFWRRVNKTTTTDEF